MSLSFPASPTVGQIYQNWQWSGTAWVATGGSNVTSGNRVLLARQTISSPVATVNFTNIDLSYDEHEIDALYLLPTVTGQYLWMRMSTDSVNWDAGANYSYSAAYANTGNTGGFTGQGANAIYFGTVHGNQAGVFNHCWIKTVGLGGSNALKYLIFQT